MRKSGKARHPVLEFFLPFPAGIASAFLLGLLALKLPDATGPLVMGAALAAGIALWAWALKREKGALQTFCLMFSLFAFLALAGNAGHICDQVTLGEKPALFWILGVGMGILGGVVCLWLTGLEWQYGDGDPSRQSLWRALLFAGVVAVGSFVLSLRLLSCANVLLDRGEPRQATAVVEELQREYHSGYRGGGHYTYHVTVSGNELTGESARLSVEEQRYEALAVGDEVFVLLHPGALGQAWLECVLGEE